MCVCVFRIQLDQGEGEVSVRGLRAKGRVYSGGTRVTGVEGQRDVGKEALRVKDERGRDLDSSPWGVVCDWTVGE